MTQDPSSNGSGNNRSTAVVQTLSPGRALHLLLVEDADMDALLLREHLKATGRVMDLHHVKTLSDALESLKRTRFDCVLLDLGLPDGHGVANVESLKQQSPDSTIVVMTGLDDEATATEALKLGAQEYAVKGMHDGESLVRIIRHAMERNQMLLELQELRKKEYFLATHDVLTRLPNRQLFEDRALQALAQAARNDSNLAMCFIDLDGFKPVNDQFGHATGDELLQKVAAVLEEIVRDTDTVARIGGDEFVVLLSPLGALSESQMVCDRLISGIASIDEAQGNRVSIGCSIGVSLFPQDANDLDGLIHCADLAMYAAKRDGKGIFRYYDAALEDETEPANPLADQLEGAIDDHALSVYFQPWVDSGSGQVAGIETLARWNVMIDEQMSPEGLLRMAQDGGLLPKLGQQVMDDALRQYSQWIKSGDPFPRLGLNVWSVEFSTPQFGPELRSICHDHDVPPERVQLEFSEGSLLTGDPGIHKRINSLADYGFLIALDNFGRDSGSLRTLTRLPIAGLKIDRSMVRDLDDGRNAGCMALIESIASVAARLNIEVTAVGVESDDTARVLRDIGVNLQQGYVHARPETADAVTSRYK